MLSKNANNKKCAPKLIFFNENKKRKIPMIFDKENWLWNQILALFDTSPLHQFSKFNNFLWVCWFSCKNLFNFVYPVWKLHNPYCHNMKQVCKKESAYLNMRFSFLDKHHYHFSHNNRNHNDNRKNYNNRKNYHIYRTNNHYIYHNCNHYYIPKNHNWKSYKKNH